MSLGALASRYRWRARITFSVCSSSSNRYTMQGCRMRDMANRARNFRLPEAASITWSHSISQVCKRSITHPSPISRFQILSSKPFANRIWWYLRKTSRKRSAQDLSRSRHSSRNIRYNQQRITRPSTRFTSRWAGRFQAFRRERWRLEPSRKYGSRSTSYNQH